MSTELSNRHYFRQAPELLNGRYSLSKSEGDLLYALLTEIKTEDEDFKDYTFTKKQLEVKLGIELNTTQLRNTAKSLMRKVFEVYRDENDWELMGFSYFSYKNATITCRFDKAMKPYLLELSQWINADLRHLVQMKGQYSQRIYLMLKEYFNFGERKFNIEELMDQLEVTKSMRRYDNFKRKILLQAVKDINKFTDIEIKNLGTAKKPIYFEEHKPSRKVEAVTFHFKKNWNDLKAFIEYIRELYANQPLYKNKEGRMLKCSEEGLLYYADETMATLDKATAQKAWEWLHEHREKLECFQMGDEI
jgi:plasmid replication initiation protein